MRAIEEMVMFGCRPQMCKYLGAVMALPSLAAGASRLQTPVLMPLATGAPEELAGAQKAAQTCGFTHGMIARRMLLAPVVEVNDESSERVSCLKQWAQARNPHLQWATIFLSANRRIADAQSDVYPKDALSKREQGDAGLKLAFDTNGRVKTCFINHSSGSTVLDAQSCRLVNGTPLRDRLALMPSTPDNSTLVIRWRLPSSRVKARFGGATPIAQDFWIRTADYETVPSLVRGERGSVRVSFSITANGAMRDCVPEIEDHSKLEALAKETCDLLVTRAAFLPALSSEGTAIVTSGSMGVTWRN